MPDSSAQPPRSLRLPAVLHVAGCAPCFGTIASLSRRGLAFECHAGSPGQGVVGRTARLDFDFRGQHHGCTAVVVHFQDRHALLSLREAPPGLLAAIAAAGEQRASNRSLNLAALQRQEACHARFMRGMQAVVDDFYRLLAQDDADGLSRVLLPLRAAVTDRFTRSYPMYPTRRMNEAAPAREEAAGEIDMTAIDEWIQRSAIAQRVAETLQPQPAAFTQRYNAVLKRESHLETHPYHPDAVLTVLCELIAPLELDTRRRLACFERMGHAFLTHASALYDAMTETLGELPAAALDDAGNLASWLKTFAVGPAAAAGCGDASVEQINELTALLVRLGERLEASASHPAPVSPEPVPGLLARDRIVERFLPATPADLGGTLALPGDAAASSGASDALGRLGDLDGPALEALYAQLREPPPVEPGPEKLPPSSQVRSLMLQAQGLLHEYTLNGLTYHDQPTHPAWALMNALEALHRGADDQGRFLDPALYQATSLAMQWLLEQHNSDAALEQVNTLLARVNDQLLAEHQTRRQAYLDRLGELTSAQPIIDSDWCIVRRDDTAIPFEVLGRRDDTCALLNRSATELLEIPAERLADDIDHGLIEEAESYGAPFLERSAKVGLTTSLGAVHAYTWQDPASGCLKRAALVDVLERRLEHPVQDPPSFCALIEIPTMRPALSSLPGDALTVMQNRTGELLREALEPGEQCGRLSDVAFLMVFSTQAPDALASRLSRLKADLEALHPEWKMIGAAVPLIDGAAAPSPSDVLRRADLACAAVRAHAGFDLSALEAAAPPSNRLEPLPFDALFLRCQKIASCRDGSTSHYEILLGVAESLVPTHTTQSFVVMAEQTGRAHELDAWMLNGVLEWMNRNTAAVRDIKGFSVNLSGSSLTLREHVDAMVRLLAQYPLLAEKLVFEVTETAAIDNLDAAVRALRRLKKLGCRVALDDFGSGYSSYSYLRSLPLDYLKIDGTYIRQVLTNKTDQALTASMVDVAHALGLEVIAEYVDSEATHAWLKSLGVDYVQGYWLHEPERLDALLAQ